MPPCINGVIPDHSMAPDKSSLERQFARWSSESPYHIPRTRKPSTDLCSRFGEVSQQPGPGYGHSCALSLRAERGLVGEILVGSRRQTRCSFSTQPEKGLFNRGGCLHQHDIKGSFLSANIRIPI
jgi:hypothetical protein